MRFELVKPIETGIETSIGGKGAAAAAAKMPRNGAAQGLEPEAALEVESASQSREVAASMGWSLDPDIEVDSPPLLTAELVGGRSIPTPHPSSLNKVTFYLCCFSNSFSFEP